MISFLMIILFVFLGYLFGWSSESSGLIFILLILFTSVNLVALLKRFNNISLVIILFSMIMGTPMVLNIFGRTPSVYWIDIIIPTTIFALLVRNKFDSIENFVILKRDKDHYLYIYFYFFAICISWLFYPPIDYLLCSADVYHLLMSISALFLPLFFIHNKQQISFFFKLAPLMSLFFLGMFIYSLARSGFQLSNVDYAFHSEINVGWARSNYLAAFMSLLVMLNITNLLISSDKNYRILSIISVASLIFSVFLISSLGAVLSLAFAILSLLFILLRQRPVLLVTIIAGMMMTVVIIYFFIPYLFERLTTEPERYVMGEPLRIQLWQTSWKEFLKNPITGIGFSNFGFYAQPSLGFYYSTSHNFILQTLAESGALGAIFLISFYGKAVKETLIMSWRNIDAYERYIGVGIFSILILGLGHALVEPNLNAYVYRSLFWFIIGIIPVSKRIILLQHLS